MEIDVFCVMPDEELFPRIRENCAKYQRRAKVIEAHNGAAVLVGGGPSLRDKISGLKARQRNGQKIFALNGACKFLNENGIVPDYQVLLDPQEFLGAYIGNATEYLVASQCHPGVIAAIPGDPIIWHVATEHAEENTPQHPDGDCLVGGGFTVGLCSMCLVYAMGYRALHLYGYDSSVAEDRDHAYPNPVSGKVGFDAVPIVTATMGGRKFKTTLAYAKQAQVFPKLCADLMGMGCNITIDADGLIMAVVEEMQKPILSDAA